ncbi:hypothetical protein GCM10023321_72480 [Pseudonocardia eucalypti]|uniref:Uncharacterized protein n=1 Tax=Pseudonocardia eucalypti TaxID=648755 RepID=A0ABP9R7S6_9PSEU|nr:hypothetical protein [Pseudonocardia eucalypti]
MADVDPALLARIDQGIAHVDEAVPDYVAHLGDLIAKHSREAGISLFTRWLRDTHERGPIALLTAATMARLAETR